MSRWRCQSAFQGKEVGPTAEPSILCVDDEEGVLRVASDMLKRLGHKVIARSDPRKALALFEKRAGRIKLVIADIVMPGITGPALAKGVHSIAPGTPVILTTAYRELIGGELTTEATEAGVRCLLPKPFTKSDLADAIAMALREEGS